MAANTEPDPTFRYAPTCAEPGCNRQPTAKIAASWCYGPLRELKNYGLVCPRHREPLLARARVRRQALAVSDDEQVGPVEVIPLGSAEPDAPA